MRKKKYDAKLKLRIQIVKKKNNNKKRNSNVKL